jgi:hypothetical protein
MFTLAYQPALPTLALWRKILGDLRFDVAASYAANVKRSSSLHEGKTLQRNLRLVATLLSLATSCHMLVWSLDSVNAIEDQVMRKSSLEQLPWFGDQLWLSGLIPHTALVGVRE